MTDHKLDCDEAHAHRVPQCCGRGCPACAAVPERDAGLTEWARYITDWGTRQGFDAPESMGDDRLILAKLMLVVTEVAEAAEAVRDWDGDNFAEELADTVIRVLHVAGSLGVDIGAAVRDKMLVNEGRPPKHGRASSV